MGTRYTKPSDSDDSCDEEDNFSAVEFDDMRDKVIEELLNISDDLYGVISGYLIEIKKKSKLIIENYKSDLCDIIRYDYNFSLIWKKNRKKIQIPLENCVIPHDIFEFLIYSKLHLKIFTDVPVKYKLEGKFHSIINSLRIELMHKSHKGWEIERGTTNDISEDIYMYPRMGYTEFSTFIGGKSITKHFVIFVWKVNRNVWYRSIEFTEPLNMNHPVSIFLPKPRKRDKYIMCHVGLEEKGWKWEDYDTKVWRNAVMAVGYIREPDFCQPSWRYGNHEERIYEVCRKFFNP